MRDYVAFQDLTQNRDRDRTETARQIRWMDATSAGKLQIGRERMDGYTVFQ